MARVRARVVVGGGLVALSLVLTGCASDEVDPVLWRQVAHYKDPLNETFRSVLGVPAAEFEERHAELIPGRWWDGVSDPGDLGLEAGGIVYFDFVGGATPSFGIVIHSGPRDADADPFITDPDRPYFGPDAVYTCEGIEFESSMSGTLTAYGADELPCPDEIANLLDGAAEYRPLIDFAG